MEQDRFAALTRQLAATQSRRGAATLLVGSVVAAALGMVRPGPVRAAGSDVSGEGFCRIPGEKCHGNGQCCSHRCKSGVCDCKPRGATCFTLPENKGLICCSGRCRRGKCQ